MVELFFFFPRKRPCSLRYGDSEEVRIAYELAVLLQKIDQPGLKSSRGIVVDSNANLHLPSSLSRLYRRYVLAFDAHHCSL